MAGLSKNLILFLSVYSIWAMESSPFSDMFDFSKRSEKSSNRSISHYYRQFSSLFTRETSVISDVDYSSLEIDTEFQTIETAEGNSMPWTPESDRHLEHSSSHDSGKFKGHGLFNSQRSLSASDIDKSFGKYDKTEIVSSLWGVLLGNVFQKHRSFLGIPYAAPPVGANRWKRAQPIKNWFGGADEIYDARKFGNHCMQLDPWQPSFFRDLMLGLETTPSEDCLYLNVFCPTKARISKLSKGGKSKLPVMVFIHGGTFTTGGTSANIYDPSNFVARNDAVVVTIQYRMSIWGFLAGKELEDDSPFAGNYGLTDAIVALQWVKRNVVAFGGDPDNITIVGHSAGAILLNYLLFALADDRYKNLGLVHRAVLFSGSTGTGLIRSLANGQNDVTIQPLFDKLSESFECCETDDPIKCLRNIDNDELIKVGLKYDWSYHWGPVVDGDLIKGTPKELIKAGLVLDIPLLVTDCIDDGTIFVDGEPTTTFEDFITLTQKYFGAANAMDISEFYGPSPSWDCTPYWQGASYLLRDALITCPIDEFAGSMVENGAKSPVYYYRFTEPLKLASIVTALPGIPDYGVFHGSELLLLFKGLPALTVLTSRMVNRLQRRMMAFMKGELPNDPKYPDVDPVQVIHSRFQVDKICYHWAKWPLDPEFLQFKMGMISQADYDHRCIHHGAQLIARPVTVD